ncbi:MAG: glycosyltransferase family A protein [Prolixibacteraceae bacterium]|jgi:glycosyltransferase involved in cell wall biosynthesis|nr:glycosyltransferase family A protein [Prolixibacteraceae bacterium]
MIIAGYILFIILAFHFFVVLVNYLSKPYLPQVGSLEEQPKISILIPARNEQDNLKTILSDLKHLDYKNFEVIVCNDHSTDKTLEVLKHYEQIIPRLQYFTNEPLPDSWMGKNFACYKLAQRASGNWLLFLDADVRVKPQLLKKAITYVKNRNVKLLSVFPEQIIRTTGEWKTIPVMNWILLSFLMLPTVKIKWFSSLSAANGQMMFFDAETYHKHQWHCMVKDKNVEDIMIARLMKKNKYPVSVLLGDNDILCHMYHDYQSALNGFSLNVHQFFVGSRLWMVFFLITTWLRLPFYLFSGQYVLLLLSMLLIFIMKYMISGLSRFSFKKNMEFHPDQLWAFTLMVFYNLKNYRQKRIEWKGRVYRV